MTPDEIIDKFRKLARHVAQDEVVEKIIGMVGELETKPDVGELARTLRK
jgi:hypothetical protein